MHALNFGLKPALQLNSMETLRRMWKLADDGGFDGCWVIDHFAALGPDRTGDVFEAWTTLAAMAQATSRVRLGSMVTGNSHRHPGEPATSFDGRHYRLAEAVASPKPVQRPHPPLWVAGSGERRSLRVVAEHADVWINANMPGTPPEEVARLSGVLDRRCEDVGRDPATIRRAVQLLMPAGPDEAMRLVEAHVRFGFTEIVLMIWDAGAAGIAAAE